MQEFVMKRKDNYWWEKTLVVIGKPLIVRLIDTPITPNMVTLTNLIIVVPAIVFAAYKRLFYILAVLVQLYMFLDIVDGNLARNKNMKSELGRKLDIISDTIMGIVGYWVIGIGMDIPIYEIIIFILVHQIYGLTATYYIVPNIRKLRRFEHTRLKQFFLEKGILFGMDFTLQTLITSVLLLFPIRKYIFVICPMLWAVDLIYRLYELKCVNRKNFN